MQQNDRLAMESSFRTCAHGAHTVVAWGVMFCIAAMVPEVVCAAAEETEILEITVGQATKLSTVSYQNTSQLCVSRTGIVVAFYPKAPTNRPMHRISKDGGITWGRELQPQTEHWGGTALGRDGARRM
jgi:hypothetical protein